MSDAAFTPIVQTAADGARIAVLPYGGHVVSWTPAPGKAPNGARDEPPNAPTGGPADASGAAADRLYLSGRAEYRAGAAVRGGVPVIWPQFNEVVPPGNPPMRHGFARVRPWAVARAGRDADGAARVELALADDEWTRARWPHPFRLTLAVRAAGAALEVELGVENPGNDSLAFTGALHTYLRVGDAARATLAGLESVAGRDQAAAGAPIPPSGTPLGFGGEVDHLYPHVPGPLTLGDPALGRRLRVEQRGFADVVVWNPGPARGTALADLDQPDGWRQFVCVEAAAAAAPVVVTPGARWAGGQRLVAVDPAAPAR